jgi:homoserine kinase
MPKHIGIPDAVANLGSLTLLLQGLRTGNGDLIADGMHDRLHEPYRWPLIQGGTEVRKAAMGAGAWGCVISGAGPSLLALCPPEKAVLVAEAMAKSWEERGVGARTEILPLQKVGSSWSKAAEIS